MSSHGGVKGAGGVSGGATVGTATASVSGVQVAMGLRSTGKTKQENKSHTSLTCYPLSTGHKSSKNHHAMNNSSKSNYMSTVPNNRSMMNHLGGNVHESSLAVAAANSAYVSVKKAKT